MNLRDIPSQWDLIVIGGGITGAGIFREAARLGLRTLLLERMDYAWGTSSRSSKLVHGGLRYLKEGKIRLTKASVEERERLLEEAPGLVEMLGFLMPVYKDQSPGRAALSAGLTLYDMMARGHYHEFLEPQEFSMMLPHVREQGLTGGFHFYDAQVDDARLVLRLIFDGVTEGVTALNYTEATEILRDNRGIVSGLVARDTESGDSRELSTGAIINATGSWAESLHPSPEEKRHLRPLRGSHLVFPHWTLPVAQAVTLIHPGDHRPVFVIPWEGAVLVGTTDLDHNQDMLGEPVATEEEVSYLMEAIGTYFPSLDVSIDTCIASFAGIRPVLSEGMFSPSEESRDHVVWIDKGLVTVTGGKLTTFRRMAWDALEAAAPFLPSLLVPDRETAVFSPPPEITGNDHGISRSTWKRLFGRYGKAAWELVKGTGPEGLHEILGTATLWAELPFVAGREQVRHLSDLLLRRVRLGILVSEGGKEHLDQIQKLCGPVLPWDTNRWKAERSDYLETIGMSYSLPHRGPIIEEEHEALPLRLWRSLQRRLGRGTTAT
ncbi:MAG: glycerol-3-phosphate dehydrogenase/oxidase [Deltaproteobacteria bacterium]|nr:glycerol-3-phosphate dehydrogenase/oxidase [Deltaproteobacteria bacterium]